MFRLLTRISNPIHTLLLVSPLHRLVSHHMILLTFHGRKSGRRYRFPVYYSRTGDVIRFFANRESNWWLNLLRGTWVQVYLQGVEYDGIVELVPASHYRMVEELMRFDAGLSGREAEEIADGKVMFHIRLQTQPEEARGRVPGLS